MKQLYLDCSMGAAGDMLAAALLELLPDRQAFLDRINGLHLPGVVVSADPSVKCGITGTHYTVKIHDMEEDEHLHDHPHSHHSHSSLHDIQHLIWSLDLPLRVKNHVLAVYELIAKAEGHVHGVDMYQIHFHEVGTMDAVADIVSVCLLMDLLSPEQVIASPIHVGSGTVRCAHGVLPVPAPATAYILRDVPIYGGSISGELCTPTGAALLKHFVTRFDAMPVMKTQAIGYGMGKKDFPQANCIRVLLGETAGNTDQVLELSCNVDDMTAEAIGFAMEQLLQAGALDVFTTPVGMKKNRPGTLITLLCRESDRETLVHCLFRHTTTLGIREQVCKRYTLSRSIEEVSTPYGTLHKKVSTGYGVRREKYEYEDLAAAARKEACSIQELLDRLNA